MHDVCVSTNGDIFRTRISRSLFRFRWWFETGRYADTNRPMVLRLEEIHFYELTEAWQWFWFDALMFSKYRMTDRRKLTCAQFDYISSAFCGVTHPARAFTNGHFSGTNYVTGEYNPEGDCSAATIVCGGNVFSGRKVYYTKTLSLLSRVLPAMRAVPEGWYLEVETLDASQPPPSIADCNPLSHPWFFFEATVATNKSLPDGTLRVEPFPQLDYDPNAPVYIPVASKANRWPMVFPFYRVLDGETYRMIDELPAGSPIPKATNV